MNSRLLVQPWLWFFACRPLSTSRLSILRCVFQVIPVATTQPALGWVARQNDSVVHLTTPMLITVFSPTCTTMHAWKWRNFCVQYCINQNCFIAMESPAQNHHHRVSFSGVVGWPKWQKIGKIIRYLVGTSQVVIVQNSGWQAIFCMLKYQWKTAQSTDFMDWRFITVRT